MDIKLQAEEIALAINIYMALKGYSYENLNLRADTDAQSIYAFCQNSEKHSLSDEELFENILKVVR